MQDTRLNRLLDEALNQFDRWFTNPWRRFSLVTIGLLGGFFFGEAAAAIAGQTSYLDVIAAGILVAIAELISLWAYRVKRMSNPLLLDCLNAFKIGMAYSMYLEAFKLGS